MSLSTHLRDYMEFSTGIFTINDTHLRGNKLLLESLSYIAKSLQIELINFISFRWIRNYSLFSINIPTLFDSLSKEVSPGSLFEFFQNIQLPENLFLTGFFNSLFLSLPFSIIQLISLRRLIIHGIPAATYSIAGYIIGQIVFISCVLFGIRGIIIPWLTFEPFNYILGLIILSRIIFTIPSESLVPIKTWNHPKFKMFFINSFILAWCEQGTIFSILNNITFSANPTIFQGSTSTVFLLNIFQNILYISGLLLGSTFFTGLLFWAILKIKDFITVQILFSRDFIITRVNKYCHILSIAFCLATIPYYTNHYNLLGILGFVPDDRALVSTVFSHLFVKDLGADEMSQLSFGKFMEVKLFPFNKGHYLVYPLEIPQTFSIEDLSYRGEFAWVRRYEKLSLDVVTTHIKGKRLSRNLGFFTNARESSMTLRILPKQTPQMTYFLDINNKFDSDDQDIIKKNLDFEFKQKNPKFKKNSDNANLRDLELPYDPVLERYYKFYDFDQLSLDQEETMVNYLVRNFIQSPTMFVATFLQNQRLVGISHQIIGMRTKQQYYQSLIYKLLLKIDIGLFLNRQPKSWCLGGEKEYDLFVKRLFLYKYIDSLRAYTTKKFAYLNAFQSYFGGALNFSNQVYNHQFLGTLRNLTRFFILTLDDQQEFKKTKLLNYLDDSSLIKLIQKFLKFKLLSKTQKRPANYLTNLYFIKLYKNSNKCFRLVTQPFSFELTKESFFNSEDISFKLNSNSVNFRVNSELIDKLENNLNNDLDVEVNDTYNFELDEGISFTPKKESKKSVNLEMRHQPVSGSDLDKVNRFKLLVKFDQPLYKLSKFDIGPEPHEELHPYLNELSSTTTKKKFSNKTKAKNKNYLKSKEISFEYMNTLPLYPGCNEKINKFILTNKPVTKQFAGLRMYISSIFSKKSTRDYPNEYLYKNKNYSSPSINNYLKLTSLKNSKKSDIIKFTCWPLMKKIFKVPSYKQDIPYTVLKEQKDQVEFTEDDELTSTVFQMTETSGIPSTRPWILELMLGQALRDPIYLLNLFVPKKGGFVWPGNPDIYVPGIKKRSKRPMPDSKTKRSGDSEIEEENNIKDDY